MLFEFAITVEHVRLLLVPCRAAQRGTDWMLCDATFLRGQEKRFLDPGAQKPQVHDLGDASPGDPHEPANLGLVVDFASFEQIRPAMGEGQ